MKVEYMRRRMKKQAAVGNNWLESYDRNGKLGM